MAIDPVTPIREIALAVPGAMALFDEVGLDYCCGGSASLEAACARAGLSTARVVQQLEEASHAAANVASFHDWGHERPAVVATHVVEHNYPLEREMMADTSELIAKVVSVYGAEHHELREIDRLWSELCRRMTKHLHDERPVLEPLITPSGDDRRAAAKRGAVAGEHEEVVALVRRIRELAKGYAPPPDACDAMRSLYAALRAFESDLHEHVLLADDVLKRA